MTAQRDAVEDRLESLQPAGRRCPRVAAGATRSQSPPGPLPSASGAWGERRDRSSSADGFGAVGVAVGRPGRAAGSQGHRSGPC
jgi:hypothetical protein